jgi:LDH2 family malate/lactate/ureidoglycolate dehydrogenase
VLAPGDREWQEADARLARGAPLAPEAVRELEALTARYGLEAPRPLDG